MVRVLGFVVFIFLVSAGLAWLADRPGDMVLNWQGYEIRTSLMVAAVGIAAIVVAILVIWAVVRAIIRAPKSFESYLGRRRRDRGYKALSDGMIAVGAGDMAAARKAANETRTLLGAEPLPLLLSAQAAQLAGDSDTARTSFEALANEPATKVLGLHGLFVEARRQDQHDAARHFAEQAVAAAPKIGWAGVALFEYQSRAGEWLGAMRVLEANVRAGTVDKTEAKKQRAALLTARAMELEAGEPQEARAAALEAHRLDPSLVPAAAVASRLLSRASDYRRAARVIEATWKVQPHPELAEAYAIVRPGDSVRDRLKRMRRLADLRANHPEGSKALARAAIDAHDWQAARVALEGQAKATPSETVCLLMAEIEGRQNGDEGKVRMWLARAINAPSEAAWIADGQVFDRWAPVTPVSGTVGGFVWGNPPEPPPSRAAIEIEANYADEPPAVAEPETVPQIEAQPAAEVKEAASEPQTEPEPTATVEIKADAAPAVATPEPPPEVIEATPEANVVESDKPEASEAAAETGPEVLPEAEPEPEAEPQPRAKPEPQGEPEPETTTTKNAANGAGSDAGEKDAGDQTEPRVPPIPDDPGPLPDNDDTGAPRRRRFRFFSNS